MLYKSPYKKGDLVTVYRDPQTELIPMGTARLREHRSTGLPFILKEATNEQKQELYVTENWLLDWDRVDYNLMKVSPWLFREDKTYEMKRLYRIGP